MITDINEQIYEFDNILSRYGCERIGYKTGSIFEKLVVHYEKVITDFVLYIFKEKNVSNPFQCRIFYVNLDEFNAFSEKSKTDESLYFIGLNYGLIKDIIEKNSI